MSVKKVVPPVVIADKATKPIMGPLVVMSGFLTKRNRKLNRWRQRWWQLLDSGILIYYNSDDRAKQLGQIDIAHSCYDVKLGRENCPGVSFPRVAPSCCCLSFTVLKRSYHLYAPTAAEAMKWAETIKKASRVLNRRVVAGVERRKAPDPPGPPRPPSCPPNMRINRNFIYSRAETFSVSDVLEDSLDMSLQFSGGRSIFATSGMKMASSMPDLLDRVGYSPSPPPSGTKRNPNDRLWLDGSPYPVTTSTFGQTFPSPPTSCAEGIETPVELQELSISPIPSPVAASASLPTKAVTFRDQEATVLSNFQQGQGPESSMNGKRVLSPRHKLQNRCSLPIIRESSAESVQLGAVAKTSLHHRPISCIPNPLSAKFSSATIPRAKPMARVTMVPVFPGAMLGNNMKKRGMNGNLARGKPIQQPQPLPRYRKRAQSTGNHLENNNGAAYRPVPKPRKSKDMLMDPNQAPLKKAMSCDFISECGTNKSIRLEERGRDAVTRSILPATSPTESERSVSLTISDVVTATLNSAIRVSVLPRRKAPPPPMISAVPPRPRRDSGPPNFVPPPPPIEELDGSIGTPSINSS